MSVFVDNPLEIVASMPCYSASDVEKQRGVGVFDANIRSFLDDHRRSARKRSGAITAPQSLYPYLFDIKNWDELLLNNIQTVNPIRAALDGS